MAQKKVNVSDKIKPVTYFVLDNKAILFIFE
jgi:hypothetical protein